MNKNLEKIKKISQIQSKFTKVLQEYLDEIKPIGDVNFNIIAMYLTYFNYLLSQYLIEYTGETLTKDKIDQDFNDIIGNQFNGLGDK